MSLPSVRPRRRPHILLLALVAAALAGCAAKESPPPATPAFMVTDDWDRVVSLPAAAERIVSLSPASTELVFALGRGDRLVGRTTWDDFPAAARAVTDVGNGIGPNVEAIAAQRPDLVLLYASEANRPMLARFEELHIPVAVLKLDRAADVRRAAHLIGALSGASAAADSLVAAFDSQMTVATMASATSEGRPLRVYVDVEANPPITVGQGSFLSEIISAAGARNTFADVPGGSGPVSLEAIIARRPDVILVLASDTTRSPGLARRPGWSAIPAVQQGRILVLDGSLYGRPSPRMPQAVADLARRLARLPAPRGARRPAGS